MSMKDSWCPFCGAYTGPYLPIDGYYPCPSCIDEKYDKDFKVKPEFAKVLEAASRDESHNVY